MGEDGEKTISLVFSKFNANLAEV